MLYDAFEFIDQALQQPGAKVLVHCSQVRAPPPPPPPLRLPSHTPHMACAAGHRGTQARAACAAGLWQRQRSTTAA